MYAPYAEGSIQMQRYVSWKERMYTMKSKQCYTLVPRLVQEIQEAMAMAHSNGSSSWSSTELRYHAKQSVAAAHFS